jgi:hypothetical protein
LNIDSILNNYFLSQVGCQSACYNKLKISFYVEFSWEMAVWERKDKKNIIKKPLIREGTNSSSIPELIINLSKNPEVSFVVI